MKRASVVSAVLFVAIVLGVSSGARCEEPSSNPTPAPISKTEASKARSENRSTNQTAQAAGQKPGSSAAAPSSAKETVSGNASQPAKAASSQTASGNQSSGGAQAATSSTPGRLPVLVVTATRLEQPINEIGTSVSVISGQDIQAQKLEAVGDALREVPGVVVGQSGSPGTLTEPSIRGATSAQTLILMDGVEVNDVSDGGFNLAHVTTDNLDRIEVLRGAGGALYGSSAVGGVINLISEEGKGPARFSLLSEGGNRATERQVMTVNGADGSLGYSGSLSYFSTTGFRPINDNSDNLSGALRLDEHLGDDTVVRIFARYSRANTSLVNFSIYSGSPLDPNAHQRDEFELFKGELEHRFNDHLLVRWNAAFVRGEIRLNDTPYSGNSSAESDYIANESRSSGLEAIYTWNSGFRSLAGFDFKDRWARSGDHYTDAQYSYESVTVIRHRRDEYAGYVQQEGSFLNGHILGTAGFRVDGNSDFGQEVSPAWSVAIPLAAIDGTLRGSYSEGFRAPSFNELYYPNYGNPNLKPEISSEYDGSFTKRFGELASFTATYFSRRVHSLVVPVPCTLSPSCLYGSLAGNAGRVDVQGIELEPSVRVWQELSLGGNFTMLDGTHRSSSPSIRPLRVPKHSASAVAQYEHAGIFSHSDKIRTNLVYTFVGDRDDVDQMAAIRNHAGYHVFDAVVSYTPGIQWRSVGNEEIYVRVQNLFDRNYSQNLGFKSPPINFVGGIKLDFAGPDASPPAIIR